MEQSIIDETHSTQFEIQTKCVCNYLGEVAPIEEKKWNDILANKHFRGNSIEAEVSNLVIGLPRHYVRDEKETDRAVHWDSMGPKSKTIRPESKNSLIPIGFNTFMK